MNRPEKESFSSMSSNDGKNKDQSQAPTWYAPTNNNGNFICVFECTIVNLATCKQFTNAAWDWMIKKTNKLTKQNKSKKKKIKIALSLGYPNSYFYNKRCNVLL